MSEWSGWPVVDESTGWEAAQQILTEAELSRRPAAGAADATAARGDGRRHRRPRRVARHDAADVRRPHARGRRLPVRDRRLRCRRNCRSCWPRPKRSLEPDFNLLGIATTTGTACVALCVHGPIARTLGVNAGTNCLGPGNRANASIGRALQLCIRNIGGARSDIGDMATMGQPGKYTLLLRRTQRRPLPDPDRAPRPRRRRQRHHGDGHFRHRRGAAGRRRRRHARGDPLADRRRRCGPPS